MEEHKTETKQGRQTLEVTTPEHSHKLRLKEWVSGGEKLAITKAQTTEHYERVVVEQVVVDLDGEQKDLYERFMDMHGKDVDFAIAKINEVIVGSSLNAEQKKS